MNVAHLPPGDEAPRDGDVVVTRDVRHTERYMIRRLPGDAQLTASGRDEAVRLARHFARRHVVDAWYSEGGVHELLDSYRRARSPQRPRPGAVPRG